MTNYTDNPTAETATQDSPELAAFKRQFAQRALDLADRHGYRHEAERLLTELGVALPGQVTITGTITVPFTVTANRLFGRSNLTVADVRARIEAASETERARQASSYMQLDDATVTYQVTGDE